MPTTDELRAALTVAELEEQLIGAKTDGPADRDLKDRLRSARQAYRENHRSPAGTIDDGTAAPAPVTATVKGA